MACNKSYTCILLLFGTVASAVTRLHYQGLLLNALRQPGLPAVCRIEIRKFL